MTELYIKYIPPDIYTRKDIHPLSRVLFAFIQSMETNSSSKSTAIVPYQEFKPAVTSQREEINIPTPLVSRRNFLKLSAVTAAAALTGCSAPSRAHEILPPVKSINWSNRGEDRIIEMMINALELDDLETLYPQACFRWNQPFAQTIGAVGGLASFISSIPDYGKGALKGTLVGTAFWALSSCGYGSLPPILGTIAGKAAYQRSLRSYNPQQAKASGILFGAFTGAATSLPAFLLHLGYLDKSRQNGHKWIRAELHNDHDRAVAVMRSIKLEEFFSRFRRHPFTFQDVPNELINNIEILHNQGGTTEWLYLRLTGTHYRHPVFSIDPARIHFLRPSYERDRPKYQENELAVFFPTNIHFSRDERGKSLRVIALDAQVITKPTDLAPVNQDHTSQVHCEDCMILADFDISNLKHLEGTNHAFDESLEAIGILPVAYTENPHPIMLELRRIFELISEGRFLDKRVDKFIRGHYVNGTSLSSIEIRYNSDGSYQIELSFDVHMGGGDFTKVKIDSKQFVEDILYPSQTGIGIFNFISKDPAFIAGAGAIGLTLLAILGRRVTRAIKK